MATRTTPRQLIAAALVLVLFGVVAFASSPIVPLYDGIGFPDEAYRYVSPPAGAKPTEPPTGGTAASAVVNGSNTDLIQLVTPENGPQAQALLLFGTLSFSSPDAKIVHILVEPVKPTVLPSDGNIAGNIYTLTGSVDSGQVSVITTDQTNRTHFFSLRVPQGNFVGPVMEYRAANSQSWQRLTTDKVGNDIYQSPIQGFGEYAMVMPYKQASATTSMNQTSANKLPIIATAVLVFAAGLSIAIIAIRRSRKPAKQSHDAHKR